MADHDELTDGGSCEKPVPPTGRRQDKASPAMFGVWVFVVVSVMDLQAEEYPE